jgi:hypothetical protein
MEAKIHDLEKENNSLQLKIHLLEKGEGGLPGNGGVGPVNETALPPSSTAGRGAPGRGPPGRGPPGRAVAAPPSGRA